MTPSYRKQLSLLPLVCSAKAKSVAYFAPLSKKPVVVGMHSRAWRPFLILLLRPPKLWRRRIILSPSPPNPYFYPQTVPWTSKPSHTVPPRNTASALPFSFSYRGLVIQPGPRASPPSNSSFIWTMASWAPRYWRCLWD